MATNKSEYTVYLTDTDGSVVAVKPGDGIPTWAKITNPYVLGAEESGEQADEPVTGPPPRAGKGSGESAWRKYAEDNGVDVSQVEGRDDIINAVDKAGVPVE
ncbi:hypothetical protein SAMN04488581_2609 [Mycolicibacterium neoaurum]|uniref:hypothetical protein n=1 Tax=Mycolicibacterium neoaurum TaxID=1795 RepID=UPI0005623C53|nr:hypothetical protein [Mycolicibacterium neoaurum]SDD58981.1 hypothetical protein SAMN04488581_2609 [Mycolicibacterium neoaurum]